MTNGNLNNMMHSIMALGGRIESLPYIGYHVLKFIYDKQTNNYNERNVFREVKDYKQKYNILSVSNETNHGVKIQINTIIEKKRRQQKIYMIQTKTFFQ